MSSILKSGDGKSPESAYKVICSSEEYAVMQYFHYRLLKQSLVCKDNQHYDVMQVLDEDQKPKTLYFNISIAISWLKKKWKK